MTRTRRDVLKGAAADRAAAALFAPARVSRSSVSEPHHPRRRAVSGRRHHRHAGAADRAAAGRDAWARASWSRTSAAAADRSAPIRWRRPRPTATRCCSTTSRSRPPRRRCMYAKRARHDFDDFVPISVGAYVPLLLLANPSVPAKDLKEFVAYAKTTTDAAVLRLDRARQHHASDAARCSNATPASRWITCRSAARRRW